MDWKEVGLQFVKKGLPLLGGLIGGPAGSLGAQAAISLVSSALGKGEAEITPETIIQTISANPESLVELRKLEMNHSERLQELLLEERKLELQDVASARSREVEIVKATGSKDTNLYVLAYAFVGGFFISIIVMMALVLTNKLPEAMPQYVVFLLGSLFGTLTAGVSAIIQYFFGSSKGSADKTKMLGQKPPINL
uniref:Holin n=1 Tax=viral metagenome TaxID=1070528 RepID=A0A6M3JWB8_9ZZZZ